MIEYLVFGVAMMPFICFAYVAIIECIYEYRSEKNERKNLYG
jgi:hypothetical protein